MNNDKKKDNKIGTKRISGSGSPRKALGFTANTTVPEAYYNRIKLKRATSKHHPIWEALNEVLVVKGGRVCIR